MTCGHSFEVIVKRSAFNSSSTKYLLADSSKFGKVAGSYFAQLHEIDIVITDEEISKDWKTYMEEELGIQLYIV
ncbi:DeoR/GlpR transcriptional regulator [Treponema parvum]|uniref:DeoR/GlpR transcriptional regulator n=1 Tax=Treponema parvum TaxID=138851 RepID=UPI001AEBADEF|nr:DeoR/GlpR transcriptional regulator [Treponema parvum]QTQ17409.1 DeoR/GlpR transcriptional regulator [Treponema parvum]